MNSVLTLLHGMFMPTCLANFVSCWAIFLLMVGLLFIGSVLRGHTRAWRNEVYKSRRGQSDGPITTIATFAILIAFCLFGFWYFGHVMAEALVNGFVKAKRASYDVGTPEFAHHMKVLLVCRYTMLGFAGFSVFGCYKRLRYS